MWYMYTFLKRQPSKAGFSPGSLEPSTRFSQAAAAVGILPYATYSQIRSCPVHQAWTPGLVVRNRQSWLLGSGIVMFRGMYFENVLHSSWGSSKAGVASHAELVATLVAQGEYQGVHFHQGHYEAMGHSLCEVLLDLVDTDQSKVEGIVQKLKDR